MGDTPLLGGDLFGPSNLPLSSFGQKYSNKAYSDHRRGGGEREICVQHNPVQSCILMYIIMFLGKKPVIPESRIITIKTQSTYTIPKYRRTPYFPREVRTHMFSGPPSRHPPPITPSGSPRPRRCSPPSGSPGSVRGSARRPPTPTTSPRGPSLTDYIYSLTDYVEFPFTFSILSNVLILYHAPF